MNVRFCAALASVGVLCVGTVEARIVRVPDQAPTIMAGINSSSHGDTVLVFPDTYYENINFNMRNITVGSLFLTTGDTSYISSTIIDGDSSGSVVTFEYGEDSTAVLTGFTIQNGLAPEGGGIYCWNSSPSLINVTIVGNRASDGGGICCRDTSSPNLTDVTIRGNIAALGGGIFCRSRSSPRLTNVTISGNIADRGGGIYCSDNSILVFDAFNRCNIYLNFEGLGSDLYADNWPVIHVIVDTFTVLDPDEYFAYPLDKFTFDILHAKVERVNQDLYVSPTGSNYNSGLAPDDPLLTISYALRIILADSANPHTIHLANGVYSPSQTGETFPLACRSHVSLQGEDEVSTILDAEGSDGVVSCSNANDFSIEGMTIQNGYAAYGGGVYCDASSPSLSDVTISGNIAHESPDCGRGGGIYCSGNSSPTLTNVTISENQASGGFHHPCGEGGGIYCQNSSICLTNAAINGNDAWVAGGGIYFSSSSAIITNCTITGDRALYYGGGIYCENSNTRLVNCILWNDTPHEIWGDSVTVTYSNIQGGWSGTGNIDSDPMFADTANGDFSLTAGSPCIDAGTPDTTGLCLPACDILGCCRIWDGDGNGSAIVDMGAYEYGAPAVRVEERVVIKPSPRRVLQNFPNPFCDRTDICFNMPHTTPVHLKIYDSAGRLLRTLLDEEKPAGQYAIGWNGRDVNGTKVASGVYFYRIQAGDYTATKKMVVVR